MLHSNNLFAFFLTRYAREKVIKWKHFRSSCQWSGQCGNSWRFALTTACKEGWLLLTTLPSRASTHISTHRSTAIHRWGLSTLCTWSHGEMTAKYFRLIYTLLHTWRPNLNFMYAVWLLISCFIRHDAYCYAILELSCLVHWKWNVTAHGSLLLQCFHVSRCNDISPCLY